MRAIFVTPPLPPRPALALATLVLSFGHVDCISPGMKKLLLVPVALLLAFSCDATDEIEAEIDCADICQRYADCFDDDYDVSACQDRCEDNIDAGEITQSDVDECDNCIDDRSCASGTLACATECLEIVP